MIRWLGGQVVRWSGDADEVLSANLRQSLIQLKADGFSHRMYCFRVVNFICGKPVVHSGLQPDMQIRLFDKRYANWDLLDFLLCGVPCGTPLWSTGSG